MIERAKFTHFPLGKEWKKQTKLTKGQNRIMLMLVLMQSLMIILF